MKSGVVLILGLIISVSSFSQRGRTYYFWSIDTATGKIAFTESAYVLKADAHTIYNAAQSFLKHTFKTSRDSMWVDDSTYTIFAKASFDMPVKEIGERGKGYVGFEFTLWCNKNWYKYSITNFVHNPATTNDVIGGPLERERTISGYQFPVKYWEQLKANTYYRIQTTIEGLKETMANLNQ